MAARLAMTREGADVAHAGDEAGGVEAARDVADGPAGAEEAEFEGGEAFERAAHGEDQPVDAAREEEEEGAQE